MKQAFAAITLLGLLVAAGMYGYAKLQPNPLFGMRLYDNLPGLNAKAAAEAAEVSPQDAELFRRISSQPQPLWLTTPQAPLSKNLGTVIAGAKASGKVPLFVVYGVPGRDCGLHSAGGADHAKQYRTWIDGIAAALAGSRSIVILEPDALASQDCLPQPEITQRHELLSYAVTKLKTNKETVVYLDAGNVAWVPAKDMAARLKQAGIVQADGFSVNVSNYYTTEASVAFGQNLSNLLDGKRFVVDTSRNGKGPAGLREWCNPPGRGLGAKPKVSPGPEGVDAYLWIKNPGESDGNCGGGPEAGQWWPERALELARNAS